MRCAGVVLLGLFFVPGLFRPFGCESPSDNTDGIAPVSATVSNDAPGGPLSVGNDNLYGAEPLIRPLRLDGDPRLAGGVTGPIVNGTGSAFPPILVGLNTGILAPDFTADPRASFHPHGNQVCASGCSASNHPTPELTRNRFYPLLAAYQQGPLDETNESLEALLFYGRQTVAFLGDASSSDRTSPHDEFLRRELKRTHALVSFRIVDEQGIVRVEMKRTRIPLDRRHVFDMDSKDLPPLVTSGTVKRVGLHHLWTRL